MMKFLFEISPFDFVTYAAAAGLFMCAALVATLVPAYKTATLDPLIALRRRT